MDTTPDNLNPRQQRFVERYVVLGNATQAAKDAGYSVRTAKSQGQRLLTNAGIAVAVADGQEAVADSNELDADWVVRRLMEIVDRTMVATPVHSRDGKIVDGQWQFEAGHAINALRELGKHLPGFYQQERQGLPVPLDDEGNPVPFRFTFEIGGPRAESLRER